MENRNASSRFRNPLPIPQMMMVPVPGTGYNPAPFVDDGYRRFLECAECNTQMRIYTCFNNDPKSCDPAAPTHTHINCKDNDEHKFKFNGAVRFRTKVDKAKEKEFISVSKEEYEKFKKSQEDSKE